MPKLGRYIPLLDTVFFLYKTKEDAKAGIKSGGTGFLVAIPSKERPGQFHIHGITNWHVAKGEKPTPCIRVNTSHGTEVFEFDPGEWVCKPGSYDIAVSPPIVLQDKEYKASFLDIDTFFLTAEQEKKDEIGPLDDVFMVGRFVNYDGKEVNEPAVRAGCISIMDAQIKQPTGYVGRSIILDMNSRRGFSGSPVFVYRTLGSHFMETQKPGEVLTGGGHYIKLLGIHWGQFLESWELKYRSPKSPDTNAPVNTEGMYVEGLSGMTRIIPAACIAEVLNLKVLEEVRK